MDEYSVDAAELVESSLYFDVISTILKSGDYSIFEFALSHIQTLYKKHVLAYSEGAFRAIKAEDAVFALFGSLNVGEDRSIKILEVIHDILPHVSVALLPYAFLSQLALSLPTPVVEYQNPLPFMAKRRLYVEYYKKFRASENPLARFVSMSKLWILLGVVDFEKPVSLFEAAEADILGQLRMQYLLYEQVNSKTRQLQQTVAEYRTQCAAAASRSATSSGAAAGGAGSARCDPSPLLVGILNDLYKSDELKLFDSFSGYMYGAAFPDPHKSVFYTLGSGVFSNLCISDCVLEAQLAYSAVLTTFRRLNCSRSRISLLTRRLCFEYLIGQLFCTKLPVETLPALLDGLDLSDCSGTMATQLVATLAQQFPAAYGDLAKRLQIYPNAADIAIERMDFYAQITSAANNILKICYINQCYFQDLQRDVYAEASTNDVSREDFETALRNALGINQ